jgi:hypothetical protein
VFAAPGHIKTHINQVLQTLCDFLVELVASAAVLVLLVLMWQGCLGQLIYTTELAKLSQEAVSV